jgi:glucose/sorbosone dehydrogenase
MAMTGAIGQTYPPSPIARDGTAVLLEDYAVFPFSSVTPNNFNYSFYPPSLDFNGQLSRINFIRAEPANAPLSATRFFVCDLNRNLYLLDKSTRSNTVYLDFENTFRKFDNNPGFAGGLITFAFDPGYASNGIFYTVHMENPSKGNGGEPANPNAVLPNGYTTNVAINPPVAGAGRQSILVEWTDTNINNSTFEGTARELLRLGFTGQIHPMGDLLFNPLAGPGDADYGNLYVALGDGGAGESPLNDDGVSGLTGGDRHYFPQRLDMYLGKILRITPDTNLHPADVLSTNGRYRIPSTGADPNPFVLTNGARPEIFAYGFRNPHRMSWDPVSNKLIATDIGRFTFEEVNLIEKGKNYGWAEREGTRSFFPTKSSGDWPAGTDTGTIPAPDLISIRYGSSNILGTVTPMYPVAEYYQDQGDAISSGFVYRGTLMPRLYGKFVFGDITTGRLLYADLAEMISAYDTNPATLANIHELQVVYANPHTNGAAMNRRMFDLVADEYHFRGGTNGNRLPGGADVTAGDDNDGIPYGVGRSDIRLVTGDGELFVISKSDGWVRRLAAVVVPVFSAIESTNGTVTVTWQSVPGQKYRVQYVSSMPAASWSDLAGDVTATGVLASKADAAGATNRFYRILVLP